MKLNHLNLTVNDVQAARVFLEKHFGLRPSGEGQKNFDVLFDDDDMVLTLIGVGRSKQVSYPKTFHIGFIQPTEAAVDELHARLKADGFDADPPARSHAWSFYVKAPGGFVVEVLC